MVLFNVLDEAVEKLIEEASQVEQESNSEPPTISFGSSPPLHKITKTTAATDLHLDSYIKSRTDGFKASIDSEVKSKQTLASMNQLRREYLYGLRQVMEITDLAQAPDAILYGNFNEKSDAETS